MRAIILATFTFAVMTIIGLWLMWARETKHWDLLTLYFVALGFLAWKLWDYREPHS